MRIGKLLILVFLFLIVLTIPSCFLQKKDIIIEKEVVIGEGPVEEYITGAGLGGGNYFLIKNTADDDLFEVDDAGGIWTAQITSCDTVDINGSGYWACGTDADTTYLNSSIDMSQIANTGNVDTGNYNLTINSLNISKINSTHWKMWG